MNTTALKKDWLAGSAVIAFLGALMLAQTWRPPGGVYELPFNLTVPAFPDPMSFTIAALLFFSPFALALVLQRQFIWHSDFREQIEPDNVLR